MAKHRKKKRKKKVREEEMLREDIIQIVLNVGWEDIDRKSALKSMVFAEIANNKATQQTNVQN